MPKSDKKKIRAAFRAAVFKRDNYTCQVCNKKLSPEDAKEKFDAHHITDRNLFEFGGYVVQNEITVCDGDKFSCHMMCEKFHITKGKERQTGLHPDDLYFKIKSSFAEAQSADRKQKP